MLNFLWQDFGCGKQRPLDLIIIIIVILLLLFTNNASSTGAETISRFVRQFRPIHSTSYTCKH